MVFRKNYQYMVNISKLNEPESYFRPISWTGRSSTTSLFVTKVSLGLIGFDSTWEEFYWDVFLLFSRLASEMEKVRTPLTMSVLIFHSCARCYHGEIARMMFMHLFFFFSRSEQIINPRRNLKKIF